MKRSFFQAAVTSILLYGCTTWTLTKRPEKKLDGNYTRMLRAISNKSWRQHPTRHQLYAHLPPITKTIQVRRTRHAGRAHKWCTPMDPHIWPSKSRTTSSNIHTYSSSVWIRDVAQKTCRRRRTMGRSGERGSGISVLAAWHDDDDDTSSVTPQGPGNKLSPHFFLSRREVPPGKGIWFGLVLWHINHCRLFNAKSCLYIYILNIWFVKIFWRLTF